MKIRGEKSMIQEHVFNRQASWELFKQCQHNVEANECYNNVFRVMSEYPKEFSNGRWKIAYGYMNVLADRNLMVRHCFIVNNQGEAIDPTFFAMNRTEDTPPGYMSFKIIDSNQEYIELITKNNNYPDLGYVLREIEYKDAFKWAEEKDMILIS